MDQTLDHGRRYRELRVQERRQTCKLQSLSQKNSQSPPFPLTQEMLFPCLLPLPARQETTAFLDSPRTSGLQPWKMKRPKKEAYYGERLEDVLISTGKEKGGGRGETEEEHKWLQGLCNGDLESEDEGDFVWW